MPPLADQLLAMGMRELEIGHVLARLIDEHYELDTTHFLAGLCAGAGAHHRQTAK